MARILLIDDDQALTDLLSTYIAQEGFQVDIAASGEAGIEQFHRAMPQLIVLDVMMPGMGGVETLRRLRQVSAVPILMLTARGDDADKIVGLELGADDYVPKPCTPRELVARIRAILRRAQTPEPESSHSAPVIDTGSLKLWPSKRQAFWNDVPVELTSTEFNLLEVLARNAGHPVSKNDLSQQALGRPLARFDRSIDVHISSIRQKLGNSEDGRSCIQTIIRQGYLLTLG